MTKRLAAQEQRARDTLAGIAAKRQHARDKSTGKTRAIASAQKWLEALTATELAQECQQRHLLYGDFDSMEEAIEAVLHIMFVLPGALTSVVQSINGTTSEEFQQPLAFEG